MIKKIIGITFLFYFLVLLQTSFFIPLFNYSPPLVLIAVALINVIEERESNFGFVAAVEGGIFLDIFSEHFIGYYVFISLLLSFLLKLVFKRFFR